MVLLNESKKKMKKERKKERKKKKKDKWHRGKKVVA
jgi:hypothetical protein